MNGRRPREVHGPPKSNRQPHREAVEHTPRFGHNTIIAQKQLNSILFPHPALSLPPFHGLHIYGLLATAAMLFFSFFKTLVDHEVTVELKNDIQIRGTLKSVDQYLNIKLDDITVVEEIKYPHLVCLSPSDPRHRVG
jgi:small nuclear ribonucleoprotein (snRNP)-like protein